MVVTDKNISKIGTMYLCKYLCTEIQLYKKILTRAVNLNQTDRQNSFVDLNETCPIEANTDYCVISSYEDID